jgi:hypothetical protein
MNEIAAAPLVTADAGRLIEPLPVRQLVRISLYWLGLTSIASAGVLALALGGLAIDTVGEPVWTGVEHDRCAHRGGA